MPNWCMNRVELTHEDPQMIERAAASIERGEFLQEFIPCPKDLKDTVAGSTEQERILEQIQNNIKNHGYGNWYDFCVGEWGTKWDVGGEGSVTNRVDDNRVEFTFDSAWSPPIAAYEKLMEQGFVVHATYYEPGMCFCGTWLDGDDDYYDYSNMSADEVADNIPSDLDDEYGISEQMREWEDEQEEDEE